VALPEEELNSMLKTAASLKPGRDDEPESSSASEESSSTSVEIDPVETVENADTEGWSLWKVLLVLGLALLVGIVIGAVKDAVESGRKQANQFAHDFTPDGPVV
jgi:flagellar biosynthesis/type III secretory pathway M-ring protein FliF/YscJ